MSNWFHKFFNPHCPHCRDEKVEDKVCGSCEVLKVELEALRFNNQRLIDNLMDFTKPKSEALPQPSSDFKPISSRHVPFSITQQRLELQSRRAAQDLEKASENQILTGKKVDLDKLENELGVKDASQ